MSKLFAYTDASDISSNLKSHSRVLKEIKELNDEFHSLRTVMHPDPEDHINLFYFTMVPNDGAMAHQPLVGRMIIPKTYPEDPPVIHLFTKTGRYNVDVYNWYISNPEALHSSMCFDVLRSEKNAGIWKPTYTISCLFASLMQAVVSYMVPQQYGAEVAEFVTMEKLATIYYNVKTAFETYKKLVPPIPEIKLIDALPVECDMLKFPQVIQSYDNQRELIVSSDPFYLQGKDKKTVGFDLSELHHGMVFSVILSNKTDDPVGKKPGTILLRNGVTATAAKKLYDGQISWFYHGKPLNQDKLKIIVTVAEDQFTICYLEGDRVIVHGDCPVSFLRKAEIGVVKQPFYLNIFLKKKSGGKVKLPVFKPNSGFIHPGSVALVKPVIKIETPEQIFEKELKKVTEGVTGIDLEPKPVQKHKKYPLYVSLELDGTSTEALKQSLLEELKKTDIDAKNYPTCKNHDDHGHVTLIFNKDMKTQQDYLDFVDKNYYGKNDKSYSFEVTGYGADHHCVAFTVKLPDEPVFFPKEKKTHITMMLKNKPPVYSNEMLQRLTTKDRKLEEGERLVTFKESITMSAKLKLHGELRLDKKKSLRV